MRNIYKYLAMVILVGLTVWGLPGQAARQRMICPSDGKKPYFGVCPGGEEPVPADGATSDGRDDSRPPASSGDCNASRRPDGGSDCRPKKIVSPAADTSRLSFEPEMVQITGGTFMMGSPAGEGADDEHPQHEVTVGNFAIGKYEVTQGEWQAVMGNNPAHFSSCGERCPVEHVSWDDVQEYIAKLNAKTGKTYRLPTEAEWEYAARAGTTTPFWTGNCITTDQANYNGNYDYKDCGAKTGVYRQKTVAVGSFAANPWGLYDTAGNVLEWTCSQYDSNGYSGKETTCANQGNSYTRAVRGGSWYSLPDGVRAAFRNYSSPSYRFSYLGFRAVQD